jgi:hypothetical protein
MMRAYQRVVENKGVPGVDGLTVSALKPWPVAHWPKIKQALLAGEYMPSAVRKVEIPKPQGGVRILGIPCALDRLIQQALHQILQPLFDPWFSESSFGFRPGRNAHQAVKAARRYVAEGIYQVLGLRARGRSPSQSIAQDPSTCANWVSSRRKFAPFSKGNGRAGCTCSTSIPKSIKRRSIKQNSLSRLPRFAEEERTSRLASDG